MVLSPNDLGNETGHVFYPQMHYISAQKVAGEPKNGHFCFCFLIFWPGRRFFFLFLAPIGYSLALLGAYEGIREEVTLIREMLHPPPRSRVRRPPHITSNNMSHTPVDPWYKLMGSYFTPKRISKRSEFRQKIVKKCFFEKLINQFQVRIQAEPMHGKYSGGDCASFFTPQNFFEKYVFSEALNLLLGTSADS